MVSKNLPVLQGERNLQVMLSLLINQMHSTEYSCSPLKVYWNVFVVVLKAGLAEGFAALGANGTQPAEE
eukprot:1880614-Amphidinium_carterae.1